MPKRQRNEEPGASAQNRVRYGCIHRRGYLFCKKVLQEAAFRGENGAKRLRGAVFGASLANRKLNMTQKRGKKLSVDEAAKKLTAIAERHLETLPEAEREARVAAFARVKFKTTRGTRAKPSSTAGTPRSRATARVR
jgi:hypothetical protein